MCGGRASTAWPIRAAALAVAACLLLGCAAEQLPESCGISGVVLFPKQDRTDRELEFIRTLVKELAAVTAKRGRDATGIAILDGSGKASVLKAAVAGPDFVKLPECAQHLAKIAQGTTMVISHNRAVLVGSPENNDNNHPVTVGSIHVVHNGLISNHNQLFSQYGFQRKAQTDTEIIAHLLAHFGKEKVTEQAIVQACGQMKGRWAIAAADDRDPNTLYLFRNQMPMTYVTVPELELLVFDSQLRLIASAWRRAVAALPADARLELAKVSFKERVELPRNSGVAIDIQSRSITPFDLFPETRQTPTTTQEEAMCGSTWAGIVATCIMAAVSAGEAQTGQPAEPRPEEHWQAIASYFTPPKEFEGDLGPHKPLLEFYDGSPVKTAEDWKRRREEIRRKWDQMLGPWPPLIDKPAIEYVSNERLENYTQHTVKVKLVAEWEPWQCYLLMPDGAGPFPAAVSVYYYPEGGVRLKSCDYARELARRGFVALSIGRSDYDLIMAKGRMKLPEHQRGTHCYWPDRDNVRLEPLSLMAYAAANAYNALASLKEVDPRRVGIVGHSYGGKWAMFGACMYDKFACGVWSDPGVTIFNPKHGGANYSSPGYLGSKLKGADKSAYQQIREGGHDLHELQALMAPRPFFVSGVRGGPDPKEEHTDQPVRWRALNHIVAVNRLLGYENRVGMSNNRPEHIPTQEAEREVYTFFEHFLKHGKALAGPGGGGQAADQKRQ